MHARYAGILAALLASALAAPTQAGNRNAQFAPEFHAYTRLSDRARLYLLAGGARDLSADTTDGDLGAHLDFTLQPVLRPRLRVAHWVRERHLQKRDGYVHSVDAAGTLIVLCLRAKNMYDTHLNGWNRQHYQAGGEVELSKHWRLEPQLARQEHSRSAAGNADTVGLVLKYCH